MGSPFEAGIQATEKITSAFMLSHGEGASVKPELSLIWLVLDILFLYVLVVVDGDRLESNVAGVVLVGM